MHEITRARNFIMCTKFPCTKLEAQNWMHEISLHEITPIRFECLTYFIILAGPKLTRELGVFPLVTTNQGVFLVGGEDKKGAIRQEIIQLYCHDDVIENCQWQEYEQQLQNPRAAHVVIPLPES